MNPVSGMISVSAGMLERCHRTEFWRSLSSPLYDVSPLNDDQVIEGRLDSRLMGSFMIRKRWFDARVNLRDSLRIAQGGMDGYQLELFLEGSLVSDCDGTDMRLVPGDIGVFDFARPHRSRHTAGTSLMVYMPRERMDAATGGRSIHGRVLRAGEPGTRLVASVLHGLFDIMPDLPEQDAIALDDTVMNMLVANVAKQPLDNDDRNGAGQAGLRREILNFIRHNLRDPDLGPNMLADHFCMSRSQIYRMFPGRGGVGRVVREERLKHALHDLCRHHKLSITAIAYDYGFSSSNQFLRAFRSHFGMTPSQARQRSASTVPYLEGPKLAMHIAQLAADISC